MNPQMTERLHTALARWDTSIAWGHEVGTDPIEVELHEAYAEWERSRRDSTSPPREPDINEGEADELYINSTGKDY